MGRKEARRSVGLTPPAGRPGALLGALAPARRKAEPGAILGARAEAPGAPYKAPQQRVAVPSPRAARHPACSRPKGAEALLARAHVSLGPDFLLSPMTLSQGFNESDRHLGLGALGEKRGAEPAVHILI